MFSHLEAIVKVFNVSPFQKQMSICNTVINLKQIEYNIKLKALICRVEIYHILYSCLYIFKLAIGKK